MYSSCDAQPPTAPVEATPLPGSLSLELQQHLEAGVEPQAAGAPNNQLAQQSTYNLRGRHQQPRRCILSLLFLQETTTHPVLQQGEL